MTTTDPTRSPAGTESVWAYTHVPQRMRGDAGDDRRHGRLGHRRGRAVRRPHAGPDRALRPGLRRARSAPAASSPRPTSRRRNANLVGGAINGGTAQLHQQLVFRPVPGLGRAETPVPGLFLASASAHPGGGVHGACGANAARAALAHQRWRRVLRRS